MVEEEKPTFFASRMREDWVEMEVLGIISSYIVRVAVHGSRISNG